MKKFLILLILILTSCKSSQKEFTTNTYYNKNYSYQQLDSILESEKVEWIDSIPIKGYKSRYYEYFYIKDSLVLRFFKNEDSVKVTKRINL